MTSSIRILTTSSLDSNPSLLIVSPDGSKTLINCGEGCQRSFLESGSSSGVVASALRVSSVNRICLTHIGHDAVGGLPGMILTTSDVAESAARHFQQSKSNSMPNNDNIQRKNQDDAGKHAPKNKNRKRKESSLINNNSHEDGGLADLEIVGPEGTKQFLDSLRHFMRRDRFRIHTHEGEFNNSSKLNGKNTKMKPKKAKPKHEHNGQVDFIIKSFPLNYQVLHPTQSNSSNKNDPNENIEQPDNAAEDFSPNQTLPITKQAVSYLFSTPPIPGKFLIEKARALKIPPGPLYAQLKSGKNITFMDPKTDGVERTVLSEEVVAKASPGVGVAVIYCPKLELLDKFIEAELFRELERDDGNNNNNEDGSTMNNIEGSKGANKDELVELDAMVHLTPKSVFIQPAYQSWCKRFGMNVDHIALHAAETLEVRATEEDASPFVSAIRGGMGRSFLHAGIFPMPRPDIESESADNASQSITAPVDIQRVQTIKGCPMMEYLLIPRSRRGLNESTVRSLYSTNDMEDIRKKINQTGAICLGKEIVSSYAKETKITQDHEKEKDGSLGELIFSGTGSAIPCKHRNVTGMYLRMANGNSMLLDVGEGTIGQLLQSWKSTLPPTSSPQTAFEEYNLRVKGIKAVWISHPHADHHLGLLRLLSERNAICGHDDPIVLMAPPTMFAFLSEYQSVVPEIHLSYIAVDCRDMIHGRENPMGRKLYQELGVTNCMSVPVAHCPHSFAIIIDGTSFGKVAYSGDCRPSNRFANVGMNTDLLIHEGMC